MPRRIQTIQSNLFSAQARIKALLDSPLEPIGELLNDIVTPVLDNGDVNDKEKTFSYISSLLDRLPESFDDRFYFDAYLIKTIADAWDRTGLQCSRMIVPSYKHEWAYEAVSINLIDTHDFQNVTLIYFRRDSLTEMPLLLDYPWLFHEMGHYLLSKHGITKFNDFSSIFDNIMNTLRLRSVADHNLSKVRSSQAVRELGKYWNPIDKTSSWANEIATDVIAFWSCGPAYLYAFLSDHQSVLNPFLISPTHPPIELRIYAVIETAKKLGWSEYAIPLETIHKKWLRRLLSSEYNRYMMIRNKDLIEGCINSALKYCAEINLPQLQDKNLNKVSHNLATNAPIVSAVDLITAAWLVKTKEGDAEYEKWEESAVSKVVELAIQ